MRKSAADQLPPAGKSGVKILAAVLTAAILCWLPRPVESALSTNFDRWLLPCLNRAIQQTYQRLKCGEQADVKAIRYTVSTLLVALEGTRERGPLMVRGTVLVAIGKKITELNFELKLIKPEGHWIADEAWLIDIIGNGVEQMIKAKCSAMVTSNQEIPEYFGWRFVTDTSAFDAPYRVDF